MSCKLGKIELKTPIILGSCDLFVNEENIRRFYGDHIGAIVLKTATKEPREGYKHPHIACFGDGLLVASGMANPGIKEMCKLVKKLKGIPVIGSITEPVLAKDYEKAGVIAIELNLSCPHMPKGLVEKDQENWMVTAIKETKKYCKLPVFAKLTAWNRNLVKDAKDAQEAGADAVVVSNLFPGTGYFTGLVEQETEYKIGDCLLGHGFGAYTGGNFLSGVLLMIKQLKNELNIPIIATGGCCQSVDSLAQSFLAGAAAFETVTPLYQGKDIRKLYQDFLNWRKQNDI